MNALTRLFAAALIGAGVPAAATADGSAARAEAEAPTRSFAYARIGGPAERIASLGQYDRLRATMRLGAAEGTVLPALPVLTIAASSGPIPVTVAEDGSFDWPMSEALAAENPTVTTNIPEGVTLSLSVEISARLPDPQRFTYGDVGATLDQANAAFRAEAGLMAFLAPEADALLIDCGTGCAAEIGEGDSAARIAADEKGIVTLPHDAARADRGDTVVLSAPARKASFRLE